MKFTPLLLYCFLCNSLAAQVLYNPQILYDAPTGLFDRDSLRSIHLNFYDPNYHIALTNAWYTESGLRLPAQLTMNNISLDSVAVGYKGNSTFYIASTNNIPKVPYNIDMNDFVSGQKLMGYKTVKLANALFDPTFAKEMTGYKIYQNYLPSPEANLMKLYVQGSYLGLYVNTESVNNQFLKKHFGENNGTLFKCEPSAQYGTGQPFMNADLRWYGTDTALYKDRYELKSDSLSGWFELLDLIDVLNNDPTKIDTILNVDRVLWYFALNQVLANTDTYNYLVIHNYYLYRTPDGLFQIIPWDLSETFIGAMLDWVNYPDTLYHTSPYYGYSPFKGNLPLVYRLLNNPTWHKQYTAHLRTVINEQISDTMTVFNLAAATQSIAYTAAQQDVWKLFSMTQFVYNLYQWMPYFNVKIAGIMRTVKERKAFLATVPQLLIPPPQILTVHQSDTAPMAGNPVYITSNIIGATQVDLMVTISPYNSKFVAVPMHDDGTNGDATAADGIYTAIVPFQQSGDKVKYYIRAQSANAMQLSPERAEYEFYYYDVSPATTVKYITDALDLQLFPNPASSAVLIDFKAGLLENLQVLDAGGKLVFAVNNIQNSRYQFNCSELPVGAYWLNIETDNGLVVKALKVIR